MTVRDSITRTGARTPGAEDYPTSMAAHGRAPIPTQCGITAVVSTCAKGRHKPNISRCMPGAGLSRSMRGKVLPYMPAFQPYRGKPAVRNDREGRGNVGIIEARSAPRLYPTAGGAIALSLGRKTQDAACELVRPHFIIALHLSVNQASSNAASRIASVSGSNDPLPSPRMFLLRDRILLESGSRKHHHDTIWPIL
jgi:hypothetical protein